MTAIFAQPVMSAGPSGPTLIQQSSPQPYTSQAQFTPPSSSETTNTSPISPRATWNMPPQLQMPSRQIRQPKLPMYVPAVLRPTEKPARQSPPKTGMPYGSPDSAVDIGGVETPVGVVPGMSRIVTEEWNEEVLGPVTGMPSRNHWKVSGITHNSLFSVSILAYWRIPISTARHCGQPIQDALINRVYHDCRCTRERCTRRFISRTTAGTQELKYFASNALSRCDDAIANMAPPFLRVPPRLGLSRNP